MPLWSHELGAGQPFLGNGQSAPFAPLHLLALPLPPLAGLSVSAAWQVLLHLLLAHCLARALGAGRLGSAFAAVSIGLSSHAVAWVYDAPGMAAAFIPGILLGVVLLARRERGAAAGLVVCALGLALSGHPETLAHTALAGLVVAGCLSFGLARRELLVFLGKLAAAALTACLAAPVLLPFVQTLPRSQRWMAMHGKPDPRRPPPFEARYLLPVIDPMVFGGPFGPNQEEPLEFTEMCSDYAGALTLRRLRRVRGRRDRRRDHHPDRRGAADPAAQQRLRPADRLRRRDGRLQHQLRPWLADRDRRPPGAGRRGRHGVSRLRDPSRRPFGAARLPADRMDLGARALRTRTRRRVRRCSAKNTVRRATVVKK